MNQNYNPGNLGNLGNPALSSRRNLQLQIELSSQNSGQKSGIILRILLTFQTTIGCKETGREPKL